MLKSPVAGCQVASRNSAIYDTNCFHPSLGYNMPTARLIVCEKRGKWAVALRARLAENQTRLLETRSLDECWHELERRPCSFLAVEVFRSNLDSICRFLMRVGQRYPQVRSVCVGEPDLNAGEYLLRETGALHISYNTRQLNVAARMARSHFANFPAGESTKEGIWARLPWKN